MADWLARLVCRVVGHQWITRQYHDKRTHEFRVCQRCGRINDDPVGHARPRRHAVLPRLHRRPG
jgi:hypothetical protein